MKTFLLTLCFALSLGSTSFAQLSIEDYLKDTILEVDLRAPNCTNQSSDFWNKYNNQDYTIPTTVNPEIKTVKINFNMHAGIYIMETLVHI